MYESFYGLRDKPFSLLPDPSFLFLSRKHQEALTLLEYGLWNQAGFIVLTGEIGAGKTTLMRYLLDRVDSGINVGLISNTHQSFGDLMGWICAAFGLKGHSTGKLDLYQVLVDFLIDQYAQGKRTLLIIDEAQNLDTDKLEQLRLLSNVNSDKDLVLQLMLLGQPQLRDLLHQPELQQFVQRVAASYHLGSLSAADTQNYINHRISVAGGQSDIFTTEACEAVHHYSNGVPRLINLICDTALVYGYGAGSRIITNELVDEFVESQAAHLLIPLEPPKQPRRPRTKPAPEDAANERLSDALPRPNSSIPDASPLDTSEVRTESADSADPPPERRMPEDDRIADDQSGTSAAGVRPTDTRSTSPAGASSGEPSDRSSPRAGRRLNFSVLGMVGSLLLLVMGLGFIWYGMPDHGASLRSLTGNTARSVTVEPPTGEGQKEGEVRAQVGDAQEGVATPPQPDSAGARSSEVPMPTDRPNPTGDVGIPATPTHEPSAPESEALPKPETPGQELQTASPTASESSERRATGPDERRASSDQAASIANSTLSVVSPSTVSQPHDIPALPMTEIEHELREMAISIERVDANRLRANLGKNVQFPGGSVVLDSGSQVFLEALALRLKMFPPIQVHVVGHTDHRGAAAVNLRLSERRAEAVALFLKDNGIPEDYLSSEGKGETAPKVDLRQEWALGPSANRRIELDLVQPAGDDPPSGQ